MQRIPYRLCINTNIYPPLFLLLLQDLLSAVHLATHASPSGAHVYLLTEAGRAERGSTLLQMTRALLQHKRLVVSCGDINMV